VIVDVFHYKYVEKSLELFQLKCIEKTHALFSILIYVNDPLT